MLALATIALLTMAGCGGDGSTPLVADETDDSSTTTADSEREEDGGTVPPPDGQADDPGAATPVIVDDEGYEPTLAMPDITDPKPHPIDDVVVSEDGDRLGVRYEGASEPCAGAFAEVAETVDTVTITLETGLNPNAAAMTCIAQVIRYELAVPLENPLGDRELVFDRDGQKAGSSADGEGDGSDDQNSQAQTTVEASPSDDGGADGDRGAEEAAATTTTVRPPTTAGAGEGPADGLSPPGAFVGLALGDAQAKANGEGRPWRIGRLDDESYALTADYNPERVTFDVDGGVVTKAVAG
ncbi:MAG: hypothetical protein ACR2QO_15810 [Acidimicrobiales bacterium]